MYVLNQQICYLTLHDAKLYSHPNEDNLNENKKHKFYVLDFHSTNIYYLLTHRNIYYCCKTQLKKTHTLQWYVYHQRTNDIIITLVFASTASRKL